MNKLIEKTWYRPRRTVGFMALAAITIAVSGALMMSCSHDSDSKKKEVAVELEEPAPINVLGTSLICDPASVTPVSTVAAGLFVETPDSIPAKNVSKDELNPNAGNKLRRMSAVVPLQTPADGVIVDGGEVHPLVLAFAEQVIGGYELGDGSADIGDPTHIDDMFAAISMDNGATWKKEAVGETADKSSTAVTWAGERMPYPGHSHKPIMEIEGNNILVAWHDKYCPSGNPFDLVDPLTEDYFKVGGNQGSIDYGGVVAPNGKLLYEVPFSCVWTARGVFGDPEGDGTYAIQWRQAQQMTTGTRDSNKVWIATADVGFALTWQEDTMGLRDGKGLGPGEGYSGATTNHGTDIWYTFIPMEAFDDVCTDADCTATTDDPVVIAGLAEKPKPAINYAYPVRITNNEACSSTDTKLYCADRCSQTITLETGNQSGGTIERCVDVSDIDYMTPNTEVLPTYAVLDGDTGASRPALRILKTNYEVPEYVAILAYEETKGLSLADPQDQGDSETDIALEGKAVYFESFFWDQPVEVSAGRVVNIRVPEVILTEDADGNVTDIQETGAMIYENARRVVIMSQVDTCEMQDGDFTFGLMYKQGINTQGGPSDMFIRMNKGFTYDTFAPLQEREVTNVSTHDTADDGSLIWDSTYLDDQSYENAIDNTFSPRGFIRGSDIYNGFEYTPSWRMTTSGSVPNNFWMHRFVDGVYDPPLQISSVTGAHVSTLDPGFFPTPKGSNTSLESDKSNPDVLFMSYGTFNMETSEELDLYYSRSTDKGATWEKIERAADVFGDAMLAHKDIIIEKEVQSLASPDGTMLFNAWIQESHTPEETGDPSADGVDSRFGLVNYDFDPAAE